MKEYEATASVRLHAGRVRLTPEQHKPRAHALKHVSKDVYELEAPVQFKRGEVFGYDGAVDKVLASQMTERAGKAARKADALL